MSKLSEFYKLHNIPQADRMPLEKNILFVVPDKGHDISKALQEFNLSPYEVAVTHPKQSVELLDEIAAVGAKVVLQVDCQLSRKYYAVNSSQPSSFEPHKEKIAQAIVDTFVGLHHHDEFSIRDGLGTVDQLIKLLKHQRRSFCCITNHGSVGGWIKQYNACKKAGIKALFGCEFYFSDYRGDDPEIKKAHRSANHLVLIANTDEGFYNIIRIHNDAQLNGFYYTPRVNRAALERWGKGITALSACYAGAIPQALKAGDEAKAQETYEFYSKVFDKFYIELQIIELEDQREVNRKLIAFAKKVGAPMVLSLDSHYLDPDYAQTHEVLMCLRQKKTILDKKEKDDVWTFDVKNLYYRDAASVRQVFEQGFTDEQGEHAPYKDDVFTEEVFSEAMANTRKIAMGTEVITLDSKIKLPKLYDDGKEVLRKKVNAGFVARGLMKKPNKDEYLKRLKYEFDIITRTGWSDYFLMMERIISDTREKFGEWSWGYGRGSASSSLIVFCLGITGVDPIEYGLIFERFLDISRPDPPDIDVDADPRIRDWIKQHIVKIFGATNVCSIGTYATYKTRAVILDVARALGESLGEVSVVTKRIEPLRSFEDDDGEEHKIDQMGFDEICEHYPELKDYFDAHPEVRRHAEILRNQVKHMGTHAGGVIISEMDLSDRIPVMYDKPSSENRKIVSAWAESGSVQELSAVGLVKVDLLGLRTLPIISDCVRLIEQTTGKKIDRGDIPISDRESILMGSKKDLVGIFQFENPVTKPIADAVGMESIMDVAVVTSLIRPGPMDAEINGVRMPLEYARRKNGGEYDAPDFIRKALSETHSLLIFQEDTMKLSRVLSGFTAVEANRLRKACITIESEFISKSRGPTTIGRLLEEGYKDDLFLQRGQDEKLSWGKIVDIWKTGKKRVRRTETSSGHFVDATRLHQFLTDDGWKAQQRLGKDDRIVCTRRLEWDGVDHFSRDLTIIIAGLLTEGYVPSNRHVATFVNYDVGFMKTFVDAFEREFGKDGGSLSLDGRVYRIRKNAITIIHSKMKRGLSAHKVIPDAMMGATKSVMRDFLSFMLGAEGSVEKSGHFGYSSKSEIMIRQIRMLLLRFDIRSYSYVKNNPQYGDFYYLYVDNYREQKKILGLSHLFPESKRAELENMLLRVRDSQFTTDTIPKSIVKRMLNQYPNIGCVESGTLFTADISRDRFTRVAKKNGDRKWAEIANSDFWFDGYDGSDEVISISKDVYDFRVDEEYDPNMVVNGVVVHNCGKKIPTLMASMKEKFISGAKTRIDAGEITQVEVEELWSQIDKFSGYGFPRPHACAYGAISTVEMWLKYHYPIQFITALINNTKLGKKKHGSSNLLVDYINYARRREMPVLNPDINLSKEEFTIEGKSIRFPLGHVKNVAKAAKIIESFQPFTGMADFYERVKVEAKAEIEEDEKPEGAAEEVESQEQGEEEAQVVEQPKKKVKKITARRPSCKVVESLIAAGAFDRFGKRNDVLAEYYLIRKKKELPEEYNEDKWQEKEAEVLGLCLSRPILYKEYEETIRKEKWYLISEIDPSKKKVMVFGQILKIDSHISKAGNSMHIVRFTDGIDTTKFFVFQGGWEFFKDTYRGEGTIAAIPLAKFDDSDGGTRFFDDRGKGVVLKKG